jgi:hypothetical protein
VSAYANLVALNPAGKMSQFVGTSGSTAIVSGVAALALAMKPEASAAEVRAVIQRGAYFFSTLPAYQAPMINAAWAVHEFGGTDTAAPTVTRTGLTENELIGFAGEALTPQATDDHGVERIELLVNGKDTTSGYVLGLNTSKRKKTMKVQVRAYDRVGNVKYTCTRTWYRK